MSTESTLNLGVYVKEVLQDELERDDKFLEPVDLSALLQEADQKEKPRANILGYPSYPLHREIANMLQLWMENKRCPIMDMPVYDLLDERAYVEFRAVSFATITPMLTGLLTLWKLWVKEEIKFRIREIMVKLGKRGLLDLLGIRNTVGTQHMWPTSRSSLERSFREQNSPNSQLSVGARALAKHHHRDKSLSWWGTCTGNEAAKNEHALENMNKILDNATWINIHWLPHDVYVIEARQEEGYGVRWTADGRSFRGFLEPQMIDGHEVGWRH
ncbi:hypothetical protein ScPMuIL_004474 [Solemya velum]